MPYEWVLKIWQCETMSKVQPKEQTHRHRFWDCTRGREQTRDAPQQIKLVSNSQKQHICLKVSLFSTCFESTKSSIQVGEQDGLWRQQEPRDRPILPSRRLTCSPGSLTVSSQVCIYIYFFTPDNIIPFALEQNYVTDSEFLWKNIPALYHCTSSTVTEYRLHIKPWLFSELSPLTSTSSWTCTGCTSTTPWRTSPSPVGQCTGSA